MLKASSSYALSFNRANSLLLTFEALENSVQHVVEKRFLKNNCTDTYFL